MVKEKKLENIIRLIILPILIALYCFRDVNRGIDLADTGYGLERVFNFIHCNGETVLSTFWSDFIGHLVVQLPGADTWLGMMHYGTAIVLVIALVAYYFWIQFLNCYVVFACEIAALALYWIPASVLYDSLSFLLFEIAIILLYYAVKQDKNIFFVVAGITLGINTFVRIPNVAQVALIVVLWYYAWSKKGKCVCENKLPWVIEKTGLCIVGYILGILVSVFTSLRFYEWDVYNKVFFQLSEKTDVEGYGLGEMAFGTFGYIFSHSGYMVLFALIVLIGYACNRYIEESSINDKEKKYVYKISGVFISLLTILLIVVAYNKWGLFSTEYEEYSSIKQLMALVYLWGILVGVINIVYQYTTDCVIIYLIYLVLLWTIPLGSSNQIYLDISNSFFLLPIICYQTIFYVKKISVSKRGKLFAKSLCFAMFPAVGLILVQVLLFGKCFTFGDSNINVKFESDNILQGMKTSDEKKEALDSLINFVADIEFEYEGVLQYCDSPGLIYVLQEKRAMERAWPELDTYSVEDFEEEISRIEQESKLPLVILEHDMAEFYDVVYGDSKIYVENEDVYRADRKVRTLLKFINENGYKKIYEASIYAVFAVE